jgi:hypothetical protein
LHSKSGVLERAALYATEGLGACARFLEYAVVGADFEFVMSRIGKKTAAVAADCCDWSATAATAACLPAPTESRYSPVAA